MEWLKKLTVFKKLSLSLVILVILLASVVIFTGIAFNSVNSIREYKAGLQELEVLGYAVEAAFAQISNSLDVIQRSSMQLAAIVFVLLPLLLYSMTKTLLRGIRLYNESKIDETRQLMFDSAPVVMTIFDKNLNILDCNKEALRRYVLKSKEDYAKDFFASSPEFQPDGSLSFEKGKEMMLKCFRDGHVQFEWMHKTSDGEPLPSEIICFCINYHGEDVMLAYAIDLRELKKSEKQRQEAAERVQLMFEHTPLYIEYWDENFMCLDSNKKTSAFYGIEQKEEYTQRWLEFFPDMQPDGTPSKDYWENYLQKVLDDGQARCDFTGIKPGGELIYYDVIGFRMKLNDKNVVITYSNDVSELKRSVQAAQRAQAAEENSQMKSRFLARMSHEIRTPIAAVLGISEIQLRSKSLPLETEEVFAKIHSSASGLLGIVNDILDLSKIESGKMSVINDKYDTASMLNDIVQLNLAFLGSKKIDFFVDIDENLPASMLGDELRIKQVLNNILSNAFKYTETGFVELKISAQRTENDGQLNLLIVINDSGRGMSSEQLEALFNEYARFHEKEIKFSQGTGLGMSITASLLELMGGSIDVQSKIGEGTIVTVKIPQTQADENLLGRETAKALKEFKTVSRAMARGLNFIPHPMPGSRVLVVDDVDTNLYVARGFLDMYKIQVETCESGLAAVGKIEEGNVYDIVFMDYMMPGMDGIETTKILRSKGYNQPIIALTANALIGQAEEFLKNGFDGFISKPIQAAHLDAVLTKFIKDKFAQRGSEQSKQNDELAALGIDLGGLDPDEDDDSNEFMASEEMMDRIRRDFLESQKNAFAEITQALACSDFKTAYRLSHNLKNMAGLLNDKALVAVAQSVESRLKAGQEVQEYLPALEKELVRTLDETGTLV